MPIEALTTFVRQRAVSGLYLGPAPPVTAFCCGRRNPGVAWMIYVDYKERRTGGG